MPAIAWLRRLGPGAALAMPALADAMTGPIDTARSHRADAAALVDGLSDDELSVRLDAAAWLATAELYLDLYAEADAHASRALTLARTTERGGPFGLYQILPRIWYVRGKLSGAADFLDDAIETARLLGTPPALAGNLFNRSVVAVAVGDLDIALATAQEGVDLTRHLDEGFVTAWAAVRLAGVLLETAQPEQALELLLRRAGGEKLTLIPGGWRAYCLELLTRCWLALDRHVEAERTAARAQATAAVMRLPLAAAWADRATAAVTLHAGDRARATERALASAEAAQDIGAPIEAPCRGRSQAEPLPRLARATAPSRSLNTQRQRSTPAGHCTTATAPSESSESSAAAPTGAHSRAPPTDLASRR